MLSGSRGTECPGTNFPPTETPGVSGGCPSFGPYRPATPDPRPGRGDALQVPGRPDSAAAGAPAGARCGRRRPQSPQRQLVPARGPRATSRAASALQGQCRRCDVRCSPAVPAAVRTPGAAPRCPALLVLDSEGPTRPP